MQFNDAFARIIQVKSNDAIKQPEKAKPVPDLIPDFCPRLVFPRALLSLPYLQPFTVHNKFIPAIYTARRLTDTQLDNNTLPDKSDRSSNNKITSFLWWRATSRNTYIIIRGIDYTKRGNRVLQWLRRLMYDSVKFLFLSFRITSRCRLITYGL